MSAQVRDHSWNTATGFLKTYRDEVRQVAERPDLRRERLEPELQCRRDARAEEVSGE